MTLSLPDLTQEIAELRTRMVSLRAAAGSDDAGVGSLAVAELETAFEELRTAQEELIAQREQLDVTSRVAAAERLRADELFADSPDALLVTDSNGVIRRANARAGALLAIDQKRIVGKPLAMFVNEVDRRGFRNALVELKRGRKIDGWRILLSPRGQEPLPGVAAVAAERQPDSTVTLRWTLQSAPQSIPEHDVPRAIVHAAAGLAGASGATLILGGTTTEVAGNAAAYEELARMQVKGDEGPCLDAWRAGARVVVEDMRNEGLVRWPRWAPDALDRGVAALTTFPIGVDGHSVGALGVYRGDSGVLPPEAVNAAVALAGLAGTMVSLTHQVGDLTQLSDQLQHALESRVIIEQAKGALSQRLGTSPDEAFELLRAQARGERRKLRDVAAEIVSRR